MEFIKKLLRNKKALAALAIIVVVGGWYIYHKATAKSASTSYVTAAIERGTLTVSVTGTGQVATTNRLDIKPSGSGAVTGVFVKNGDEVSAGKTLITLDQKSASASLAQAQAQASLAQASYDKLLAGATSQDIQTSRLAVDAAQRSLDSAKRNLDLITKQQNQDVINAHSALFNAGLQATANDTLSTATVTLSGTYTGTDEGSYMIKMYQNFYTVSGLGNKGGNITRGLPMLLGNGLYITFSTTGTLNPDSTWTINVPNTYADTYLSAYNTYQSALLNQPQALAQAQDQVGSAQDSLTNAQAALDIKLAAALPQDVASAQAQIDTAKAQLQSAYNTYSNTVITAPFDGMVASVTVQKGDQASSSTAAITLITKQKVATVALNEVDAAKVKVGQKATLTFDAVDGLTITGDVVDVDTLGTVTQNVVTYNAKILFDTQDDRVKPGMSSSAAIITDVRQDVLLAPSAAVKTQGGQSYVQTLANGVPQDHTVQVGASNDSQTEVSGDVKEGDEVITQTVTSGTTSVTSQTQGNILQGLTGGNRGGGFGGGGGR